MSPCKWAWLVASLAVACGDGDSTPDARAVSYPPGAGEFRYDAASGRCLNDEGEEGLNPVSVAVVFESRDGECGDFRNAVVPMANPFIERWNLRGADLTGAELFFQDLRECAFEGTRLHDLRFGYAGVTGWIDSHTTVPGGCPVTGSRLVCSH